MKTKEFIKSVEALGFQTYVNGKKIKVCDEMRWDDKKELMTIVSEYMLTDPKEREEEKRYWLQKIPVPLLDKGTEKKWLWKYTRTAPSNMFGVDTTKIDSELYKTIFTESEISQMDITGFEKVEVTE